MSGADTRLSAAAMGLLGALCLAGCERGPLPKWGNVFDGCLGDGASVCAHGAGACGGATPVCGADGKWRCEPLASAGYEPVETRCDGIDNDCDGQTDEGLAEAGCTGGGSITTPRCISGDEEGCEPQVTEDEDVEICDGLDNDSDGETDEGLGTVVCGQGVCARELPRCAGGHPSACDPFLGAGMELCDGLDNDCDGESDEDLVAPLANASLDECGVATMRCDGDNGWSEPDLLDGRIFEDHEVSCDGRDNDCDGLTDEDFGLLVCGRGMCMHTVEACVGGTPTVCDPFLGASPETCDGRDNDCDGLVDEDLVPPPALRSGGVCGDSSPRCEGAAGWTKPADPVGFEPTEVSCDGLDNDCDGQTDEGLGVVSCGRGVCWHTKPACTAGVAAVCDPLLGATDETCDGVDNDCDGQTDEDLGVIVCGRGFCTHPVAACVNGVPGVCDPLAGATAETCDSHDNDCDGQTDEDLGSTTCGKGVCAHTVAGCLGGVAGVCDPLAGAGVEVCDGRDNDCDGQTDEGLGVISCGRGLCERTISACVDGVAAVCEPLQGAVAEVCDGRDNDCDGQTDEGLTAMPANRRVGVCEGLTRTCAGLAGWVEPNYLAVEGYEPNETRCDARDNDCDGATDEGLGQSSCGVGICAHVTNNCEAGVANQCLPFAGARAEVCNGLDDDCDGVVDEGALCGNGHQCEAGECVADETDARCGDGRLDPGEACDDGNRQDGDACSTGCDINRLCGLAATVLGGDCTADLGARPIAGYVSYEARTANDALSDWGAPFSVGLGSALVVSYAWKPASGVHVVYDVAATAADGSYRLRLPTNPGANDIVLVWLANLGSDGKIAYAVANPGFAATGRRGVADVFNQGALAQLWSFSVAAPSLLAAPDIQLGEGAHLGSARVFDHVRYVNAATADIYGRMGDTLVVWMQPSVSWDCGACSARYSSRVGSNYFASSIWIAQDADQTYWSDAVIVHELGHWVMSAFGTSPREGGVHYLGQPTLPGQAWSEGFATFFSSLARRDEVYFDKQRGVFFWLDLREMAYPSRAMVLPTANAQGYPYADDPILQLVDENVVAAMGYALAVNRVAPGSSAAPALESEGRLLMEALATDRLNVQRANPSATFQRRYVRHTWTLDEERRIANITPVWTSSAPMFADYLDAVRCLGAARGIDLDPLVAEAILTYPYPIDAQPICN